MNTILRCAIALLSGCMFTTAWAEIPSRYYSAINGKKDSELKTALYNIISKRAVLADYNTYYKNMPQYFQSTDIYPGTRQWWDMYSDIPFYAPSFSGLNREHCVPKSWWGGTDNIPIYADLSNLFPSEAKANQAKSNYPLGKVSGTPLFDNGVSKIGYPSTGQGGGASRVFEPDDEYKGDFARTYFYMITCYQDTKWTSSYMMTNSYPNMSPWAVNLLLQWHRDDIVSNKEKNRNDEVYKIQNNRNPFIDYPELVEYIWGNKKGELFYEENVGEPTGDPLLITPVQDMALDFSEVAVNNSTVAKLYFKGEFLTGTLSLAITGTDKSMFSLSSKSIATAAVNSTDGYWLNVTYTPTAEGIHNARLIISDGGLTGSRGIALRGQALPVPRLTALTALPAENITENSYTAVWEEPDQVVDYYIVSRTRYLTGNSTTQEILAESNSLVIDDYDPSVAESYNVRSVRLGYESPVSNEIYVDAAGIEATLTDRPLGTVNEPGAIRFVCTEPHTGGVVYDMQGRTVITIEVIENNTVVELPTGVYVIATDQCRVPVKIVIK